MIYSANSDPGILRLTHQPKAKLYPHRFDGLETVTATFRAASLPLPLCGYLFGPRHAVSSHLAVQHLQSLITLGSRPLKA